MALVVIPMAFMTVITVMTIFSVGAFSVSNMLAVIRMLFKVRLTTVGIVAFFIIPVTALSSTVSLVSMTLVVLLLVSMAPH